MTDNSFVKGQLVFSPDLGMEGQVLQADGHRVQVWWEDDDVSWESAVTLKPLSDRTP